MKWRFFLILIFTLAIELGYSQSVVYQDICHCGVTAGGFSTGLGSGTGKVELHIEPGSTIRKAYLFSYTERNPSPNTIIVNSVPYLFDASKDNCIMNVKDPLNL